MHLSAGQVDCKNHLSECTIHLSEIYKAIDATYVKIRNMQSSVGQVLQVFHLSDCHFYSSQTIGWVKFRTLLLYWISFVGFVFSSLVCLVLCSFRLRAPLSAQSKSFLRPPTVKQDDCSQVKFINSIDPFSFITTGFLVSYTRVGKIVCVCSTIRLKSLVSHTYHNIERALFEIANLFQGHPLKNLNLWHPLKKSEFINLKFMLDMINH